MKHLKIKLLNLTYTLTLISCNNGQAENFFIKVGFNEFYGTSYPISQVGLAFIGNKKQSLNASFDVYIGARKGFVDDWENNLWGCNPGYGKFAINRVIEDEDGNELQNNFIMLDDFPNNEKYILNYEKIEGTADGIIMQYEDFVKNTIDFSTINIVKGKVGYYICYYDDINNKIFEENYYLYGISWGGEINFEKKDDFVIFSK